ncbi:MAG: ornithine carbamoyltransferase [Chloroflexi bacterium]|nr:ornithine carbamoyltransferase [Chloroflexota bacterium]
MKHFLSLADWSADELWQLIESAVQLKQEWQQAGGNPPLLKNKLLAMVFQKPSLRTRVSFEVGMKHLGGDALMLGPDEIGLGQRESIADVARVLSGYVQGIMARVFDHQQVIQLAQWASVPVINGLSDAEHPCQAMGDTLTIYERFGRVKGLRLAYIGDGNNVAISLAQASAHFGMHFVIASPQGYELPAAVVSQFNQLAARSGSGATITLLRDPAEAATGADVIYTDTWVSMGQEAETAARVAVMQPYQVNTSLLGYASRDVIVMHCLPAHRGQEITNEVADGPHSAIFQQAENRLHAQKAILAKLMAS